MIQTYDFASACTGQKCSCNLAVDLVTYAHRKVDIYTVHVHVLLNSGAAGAQAQQSRQGQLAAHRHVIAAHLHPQGSRRRRQQQVIL